jgi:EmrB/QacA subfamily drug resistance transporter
VPVEPHRDHGVHPNLILAVTALAGLAYAMLSSAVIPALSSLQHSLHTNETGVTWLLTGYLLSASVGTSIIGRLGDMYGKERLLLGTLVMLAVGILVAALSSSLIPMIIGRVIQGAGGGIFPLAFGIVRDEFPKERVAGSIGLLSSILGVGGGIGIVIGGLIVEHLNFHWLYWIPLVVTVIAAFCTWRFIPESPVRTPGRVNWLAAALMSGGFICVLIAISETITWGWGSPKTLGLLAVGLLGTAAWVLVEARSDEPLIDMTMMRIRGVWTTNLVAFLLGAGMYASFLVFPQFAELPTSTGFGFGASVVTAGLYLLPAALLMTVLGTVAGRVARRFGSKLAVIVGSGVTAVSFGWLAVAHAHPYDMLISAALLGIGIGLAFSALGNLIVEAVPPEQTGVATGMNTVMRTLGGALGGQIVATFIANNAAHGHPTLPGFTSSFALESAFLIVAMVAAVFIPALGSPRRAPTLAEPEPPVGIQRKARADRKHDDRERDGGSDDRIGGGLLVELACNEHGSGGDGHDAGEQHARELHRRGRDERRRVTGCVFGPLPAGEADTEHPEHPAQVDDATRLEGSMGEVREPQDEADGVERDAGEQEEMPATGLLLREAPEHRERGTGGRDIEDRVREPGDHRCGHPDHVGPEEIGHVQGDAGEHREHHRTDIEHQGVDRQPLALPHEERRAAEHEEDRGAEETEVRYRRYRRDDARDVVRVPEQLGHGPGHDPDEDQQPRPPFATGRTENRAGRPDARAEREAGPAEIGGDVPPLTRSDESLDEIHGKRADDPDDDRLLGPKVLFQHDDDARTGPDAREGVKW